MSAGFAAAAGFGSQLPAAREPGGCDCANAAAHLARTRSGGEADANDQSFAILVFAGVRFAAFGRVQEEPSMPRTRLVYIHLQNSFETLIDKQSNSRSSVRQRNP